LSAGAFLLLEQLMTLGTGKATPITDDNIASLARTLGCHPATIEAIAQVESNGHGWFADGRMKILFEKHWFYKLIPEAKRANAVKNGLARKNWLSPQKGGYKDQGDADSRYKLLTRAIKVDEEAAYKSISMGVFQIMGFNHKLCGHQSAKQMFDAFCDSEGMQLSALAGFLVGKNLSDALKRADFDRIEQVYNGGGLGGAYASRMEKAYDALRAGKWANWGVQQAPKPTPKPVAPSIPETPVSEARKPSAGWIILIATAGAAGVTAAWEWIVQTTGLISPWW
jgi:hypothetical protein